MNVKLGTSRESTNIAEININGNVCHCIQIAQHLNNDYINIGPTLAAATACLSDYEESHHISTDVSSHFYFCSTITESNILKNF